MRRNIFLLVCLFLCAAGKAQNTNEWIVAFPITDYIVPSDSVQIVQVALPAGISIGKGQVGLLKSIYRSGQSDTATIGFGKCHLIKGNYYYFPIRVTHKNRQPAAGDLVYTKIARPSIYMGLIPQLAAHAIVLQSVEDSVFYESFAVMQDWTTAKEESIMKTLVKDINYTGTEMKKQMPAGNKLVTTGTYKDKMIFDIMQNAKKEELVSFLNYVVARPQLYAGNTWKVSETFATWVDGGAPVVK